MIKYDLGLTSYEDKLEDKIIFFLVRIPGTRYAFRLREALSKLTVCLVFIYDVFIVQNILTAPTKVKAELNIGKVRCLLFIIQIVAKSG
jgi:hypothetical protein